MQIDFVKFVYNRLFGSLDDVEIASPSDGDITYYDSTAVKWKNGNAVNALQSNFIPTGTTWVVPEQRQLIISDKLTMEGDIEIYGILEVG